MNNRKRYRMSSKELMRIVDDNIVREQLHLIVIDWVSRNMNMNELDFKFMKLFIYDMSKEKIMSLIEMMDDPESLELYLRLNYR